METVTFTKQAEKARDRTTSSKFSNCQSGNYSMWQGVRHGHETLLPWQLLSVFFLKAEKEEDRSAVDLQPRLHKTQEKMNESSGFSRANDEEKTEESREQQ
jgi:hypothetical protein